MVQADYDFKNSLSQTIESHDIELSDGSDKGDVSKLDDKKPYKSEVLEHIEVNDINNQTLLSDGNRAIPTDGRKTPPFKISAGLDFDLKSNEEEKKDNTLDSSDFKERPIQLSEDSISALCKIFEREG